jgi:glycosyltransferase involved in cell wall biosynthesis
VNVLFLNSIREQVWGGGEKWMLTAGSGLRERGHGVIFAGREGSLFLERCAEVGFATIPLRIGSDFGPGNIIGLRGIFRARGIDVAIANFNKDVRLAGLAALGLRRAGENRTAVVARNGLPIIQNNWRYRWTYKRLSRGILTNSSAIKERYLSYGWMEDGFIKVIHNGIDPRQRVDFPRSDVLAEHGIPDGRPIIGIFGRLTGQKGHDLFLEVARRVLADLPGTLFLIVGDGPLEGELRGRAKDLGVAANVLFLGFHRETMPLYSICDLVLLTSRSEGLPNVILEAMLAGRATVSFDVGGVRELIPDARVGAIVPKGDLAAMTAQVSSLLRSAESRGAIGRAARLHVTSSFSVEQMVRELETWLAETSAEGRSSR